MIAHFRNGVFAFETGLATDRGCRREINEDSLIARPDFGIWAVADGMGGHAAGDFASAAIAEELDSIGVPVSHADLQARLMDRLIRANDAIRRRAEAQDSRATIGSTVVALLAQEAEWSVVWSGDSRAYLMRGGQLVQQSRDHSELRALIDAGQISEDEAKNFPRKNVITRAIGVTPRPQCDIVSGELLPGDRFLLCSDGLCEHLEDAEIAAILAERSPQDACDALIAEVLARGARDNVTIIVVACSPDFFDEVTRPSVRSE